MNLIALASREYAGGLGTGSPRDVRSVSPWLLVVILSMSSQSAVRLSKIAAFGGMDIPAPASRGDSASSKTVTFMPRALSASAADNPPIPAPTMAIFSLSVIGTDPPVERLRFAKRSDRQLPMTSSSSTHLVPSKRAILAFLQPIRFDGVTLIVRPGRNVGS